MEAQFSQRTAAEGLAGGHCICSITAVKCAAWRWFRPPRARPRVQVQVLSIRIDSTPHPQYLDVYLVCILCVEHLGILIQRWTQWQRVARVTYSSLCLISLTLSGV